jgi:hypothetical protein
MKNFRIIAVAATLNEPYLDKLALENHIKITVGGTHIVPTVKQEFIHLVSYYCFTDNFVIFRKINMKSLNYCWRSWKR